MPAGPTLNLETRRTLAYRGFRAFLTLFWRVLFRPKVTGREHVPAQGAVILAPVHRSNLDFAFTMFMTPRKSFFMAKDSLWTVPVLRWWITMMGAFPVKRGTADRESLHRAQQVLERGQVLVLFPEGTRQEGPTIATILDGAAFLAARTGAPIVPVGIGHTERAMPRGAKLPHPVRVTVTIGEPLAPPPKGDRVSRSAVAALSGELRAALQRLYDEAMA